MATIQEVRTTSITLANASQLVASVINGIAGNDISNSVNGSKVTNELITFLVSNRIIDNLSK